MLGKEIFNSVFRLVPQKKYLKYIREENRAFVRAPGSSLVILNDIGATIFELCNGSLSIKDIACKIEKMYPDIPAEKIQFDTIFHIRDLQNQGLIDLFLEDEISGHKEQPRRLER